MATPDGGDVLRLSPGDVLHLTHKSHGYSAELLCEPVGATTQGKYLLALPSRPYDRLMISMQKSAMPFG